MGKLPLVAVLTVFLLDVAAVQAANFRLPEGKPRVYIALPDAWKPEKIEKGVQGQTADNSIYFAAETTSSEAGMNSIIDEVSKLLSEQKVSIEQDSKQETKYTVNGLPADEVTYLGRGSDGPVEVKITFVSLDKENVLVLTYWAAADAGKKHGEEIKAIMRSIKTVK